MDQIWNTSSHTFSGYYPLFISKDNLEREQDHLEGFAAEVAWVTHGGKTKLEKRA
jgi:prolyl-tRNA synthetase